MKEKILINKYPATNWQSASPIGNGRLGALVMGSIYNERIIINHEALFNNCVNKDIPDISSALSEVRRLMDEKRYLEAEKYYTDKLTEKGYIGAKKGEYFPAFDLHFIYPVNGAFTDYSRELDLSTGVSKISFKEKGKLVTRRMISSFTDNFVFMNIQKEEPFSINYALEQRDLIDSVIYNGDSYNFIDKFESQVIDNYIYSTVVTKNGLKYSGIVKLLSTDGNILKNIAKKSLAIDMQGVGDLANSVAINNATNVTLAINVEKDIIPFEKMKEKIDEVKDPFETLLTRHSNKFKELFERVTLDISSGSNVSNDQLLLDSYNGEVDLRLIEKAADFGRYLLLSSSYGCKFPANLQGIWNGDYSPVWSATYFNNENLQMCYWQAFRGDLLETLMPVFDLYDSLKDDYRLNAKNLFGCRGILLPLFMDNQSGKKDNLQPHVLYWTGSSAWISQYYYDYYLFTQDKDFLMNRAYPFLKESALFYEDFYVIDEKGCLKSYPSDSPENRANGNFEGAKEVSCSINPTMDFALLKELLTNLVNIVRNNNLDEPKLKTWEDMLNRIPPYQINEEGAIKEWMHEDFLDNYMHRHLSHIYPLFPGREVTKDNNPELFSAMKEAVYKRLNIGLTEQTGWSFAHMANIYARLEDGDSLLEVLGYLTKFCMNDNLFTFHNDNRNMGATLTYLYAKRRPFQIDANMGFTSAIYEMLVYTNNDEVKVFPALPTCIKQGSCKGLKVMGDHKIDLEWKDNSCKVIIYPGKTKDIKLKVCGYSNEYQLIHIEDKPIELSFKK